MKNRKRNNLGQFVKHSSKSEISFVNLSTYTSPEVTEVPNQEWIGYGEDNNYFQFLIDRYNGSPTNNACINGISQQIYGKGLGATDSNRKPEQYAEMITLFKKDIVRKLCYDLKLMGQCAMQVIYSKDRSKIAQIEHMPIETLRAEKCNEDGDIPAYFYFKDWTKLKPSDQPLRIPAYGMSKENIEIYYIKPYKSGFYYYAPVDYQGGIQYAELEEEISNYHLNNIMNGLSPSMLINFNNGTPNPQEREMIESRIAQKFSGSSNAGKFILSFNDNKDAQAEITPVQLSDAHNQYQFLSDESQSKVLVAHRVVSPMLLGIKDNTGLGNNADEIKTASLLMDNTVIRPFQELLIDSFDNILAYNNVALNLYFITLQPLEFTDVDRSVQSDEEIEEETGVKMSVELKEVDGLEVYETKEEAEAAAEEMDCSGHHEHIEGDKVWYMPCESHDEIKLTNQLNEFGQSEDELLNDYELIDVSEVDYDNDDNYNLKIEELNTPEISTLSKIINLVKTGKAYSKRTSQQDGQTKQSGKEKFLVRYQYAPLKFSEDGRKFCKAMVRAKKIYRKEDIIKMGKQAVNPGFGEGGSATYSIWLYKGGARCQHKWFRKTYMLTQEGVKSEVTTGKAKSKGFKYPVNDKLVPVAPKDMQFKGYTKAYWDKMGFKN
tara:strand:+ start:64 stop:2046 length:1983 start_codon:yes stop_codon:yes gene_type:complete